MLSREIKFGESDHTNGIIDILQENLIANRKNLSPENLENEGFLIHGFTEEDARNSILDKENYIVLVSIENNQVIGYTIGCNIKKLNPEFLNKLDGQSKEFNNIFFSEKIFYHRHIAKKPHKNKVGSDLLQAILNETKKQEYRYIICQIAHYPFRNRASIMLHEKFGFINIGTNQDKDFTLGIYLKKL